MPIYLKFVFTFTDDSLVDDEDISRLLLLNDNPEEGDVNEINFISVDLFANYGAQALRMLDLPSEIDKEKINERCEGDFERILDLAELLALKIPGKDILETYDMKLAAYLMAQMEAYGDTPKVNILLRVLC